MFKRKCGKNWIIGGYLLLSLLLSVGLSNCQKAEAEELPALFGVETPKEAEIANPSYAKNLSEVKQGMTETEVKQQAAVAAANTRSAQVTEFRFFFNQLQPGNIGKKSSYIYEQETVPNFYLQYAFNAATSGEKAIIRLYYPLDFNMTGIGSERVREERHYVTDSFKNKFTGQTLSTNSTATVVIDGRRYRVIDHVINLDQKLTLVQQPLKYGLLAAAAKQGSQYGNIGFPDNYKFKIMADVLDYDTGKPLEDRIQEEFIWKYPQAQAKKAITLTSDTVAKYESSSEATEVILGKETAAGSQQTSAERAAFVEYRFRAGTDYKTDDKSVTQMTDLVIEDELPEGAEFIADLNPGWTQIGNVVRRVVPISERKNLPAPKAFEYPLVLRYPNAKTGDRYTNTANLTGTVPKNAVTSEGVTYNPYSTPNAVPNAYEQSWSVTKPITAKITEEYDINGIFNKYRSELYDRAEGSADKLIYYDTAPTRETGVLTYYLSLITKNLTYYNVGELKIVDTPGDDRFEVASIEFQPRESQFRTGDGSPMDKAFSAVVELNVGGTVNVPNINSADGDGLESILSRNRGNIKTVTIKNRVNLIAPFGSKLLFIARLRAKKYQKPLLDSQNAVTEINNEGIYYGKDNTAYPRGDYAPIKEFIKMQGISKSDVSKEINYEHGKPTGEECVLPSPTLCLTKNNTLKDATVVYLLPNRKDYNIGHGIKEEVDGEVVNDYDLYEDARKNIETSMNEGNLIAPSVASFTGGKVELVENYKGTGKVGLVISFSTLTANRDIGGTKSDPIENLFSSKSSIYFRANEFSPETFYSDCYFKGTPTNFDDSKYIVNQEVNDELDINNNGDKTELVSTTGFTIKYKRPYVLRGLKETRGALDEDYVDFYTLSRTTVAGGAKYRLSVMNYLMTTVSGVTIMDVFPRVGDTLYTQVGGNDELSPRNSEYNMYLNSYVTCSRSGVTIYYSTKPVPKTKAALDTFMTTGDNWVTTRPADLKSITAIKTSGVTFQPGETITLNFDASVDPAVLGQKIAVNSFVVKTNDVKTTAESNIVRTEVNAKNILITKKWDDRKNVADLRPAKITVNLLQNDKVFKTLEISGGSTAESWSGTFTGLPLCDEDGKEWVYTIEEVDTPAYDVSMEIVKDKDKIAYTITNKLKEDMVQDITVTKKWDDINNKDGVRPTYVKLQLKRNGKNYSTQGEQGPVIVSASENWKHTFTNLAKYDEEGKLYVYTVEEVEPEPLYKVTNGNKENDYTVTNLLVKDIPVTKKWADDKNKSKNRPSSIVIRLKQNGKEYEKVTLEKKSMTAATWTYLFKGVPVYDDSGKEYVYTVEEDTVPNYATGVETDGQTWTITNTPVDQKDIIVKKVWNIAKDEQPPGSIQVQLKQNGVDYGGVVTLSASPAPSWQYTYKNIPIYDSDGKMYDYTIEEVSISEHYKATITKQDESDDNGNPVIRFTITNTSPIKIYVLQKVLDPIDSLPVPTKAFYRLSENGVAGSAMGLTSKSLATEIDTEVAAPKSDYEMYVLYPQKDGTYTIEDVVPEYYSFVGAVSAPCYNLSEIGGTDQAVHVSRSIDNVNYGQKTQPFSIDWLKKSGYNEYWVTFYITPNDDTPRPYSWDYKTNTFGK